VLSVLYAIPSLALLAILIPVTGLGMKTAILVISLYAQFILLRSIITGFQSIDESILESCKGMGLSALETLLWVQLPLTAPVLVSGIRLSTLASVGIATIAASINSGGIGELMFEGMRSLYVEKILWGILLSTLLCLIANQLFGRAEAYFTRRAKGIRKEGTIRT
jgi:osmoprotectant transport system permease protein